MAKAEEFTKYERARIIGARGLQISMDAPLLMKFNTQELEQVNYDPLKLAARELDEGVLPISINRPKPDSRWEDLEKIKIEEASLSDEEKIKVENEEEKEIAESGEIKELVNVSDDDFEEETSTESSESEYE